MKKSSEVTKGFCCWNIPVAILFVSIFTVLPAQATPIRVEFSFSNFISGYASVPAPVSVVSGEVIYDAASTTAPIDSLTSIDLTINTHTYHVGEIDFDPTQPSIGFIGGTFNSPMDTVEMMGFGTDDFLLKWSTLSSLPTDFEYTTQGTIDYWKAQAVDNWRISEVSAVPEPTSLILFGTGLGLLGLTAYRRKRK